mmetsp:Transcript_3618/g.8023  ORF Transcript_3618/g.8023 Transcript_3618/m.8023 type:complete len:90 (-) Transcript_3618:1753-2022(-)
MGWIESLLYFCVASETGRGVAAHYAKLPINSLLPHKLQPETEVAPEFEELPPTSTSQELHYIREVYIGNYIQLPYLLPKNNSITSAQQP